MKVSKYRDLTIIDINDSQLLIISCDSSGGIGDKENDVVKTTPEIVGYFGAQVSLMEVLSFGAKPISVIDTLSVEMKPTGERIIEGIKEALKPLNFDIKNILTGSTEENFPVSVTAMGITVIGIIDKNELILSKTSPGDIAVVVGVPSIGNEVLENSNNIMSIDHLLNLKEKEYIKEILPVGSKGILYELKEMAKSNDVKVLIEEKICTDIYKSAGPSTCVIVSLEEKRFETLNKDTSLPMERIGKFV